MSQEKNERLVLRVSAELKNSIDELAKRKNVSTSEFIRNALEDIVYKNDYEIQQTVLLIKSIENNIAKISDRLFFNTLPNEYQQTKEEVRYYTKLANSNKLKVIDLIIEEKGFNDKKIDALKLSYTTAMNNLYEFLDMSTQTKNHNEDYFDFNDKIQEKTYLLEEKVWTTVNRLYMYLLGLYGI